MATKKTATKTAASKKAVSENGTSEATELTAKKPAAKKAGTAAAEKAPAKRAAAPKAGVEGNIDVQAGASKSAPTHAEIEKLAHKFWEERGHHHGSHVADWLRAERELGAK